MRWVVFFAAVLCWAFMSKAAVKTVVLSPPADMVSDVEMAMSEWNRRCPGMFKLGTGGVRFDVVSSLPDGHIGEYGRGRVSILEGHNDLYMNTLMHEIGHAAGMGHSKYGILYYQSTGLTRLSRQDIEEARSAGWKCQ